VCGVMGEILDKKWCPKWIVEGVWLTSTILHCFNIYASPLDPTLLTSMSSNDPTFTFFMPLDKSTNLCPSSTPTNHRQHSFRICRQISFRRLLLITTSSTWSASWFALCDKICILQEMALANHVWNFPIFRCR